MFNGTLFQQSLQDLVKGIRAHRRDEDEYVRTKMAEIADECRSPDQAKKATAVLKLTHVRTSIFASDPLHIRSLEYTCYGYKKCVEYLSLTQTVSDRLPIVLLRICSFK